LEDVPFDIVRAAQQGDQEACREIIERLHRPMIATIYRFLGSRYRNEVEDIAQDVFLKVFRAIERFDPERGVKFTTWVYTFIRNHCFDLHKKKRLPTQSLQAGRDEGEADLDLPDPDAPRPGVGIETTELGSKIEEALASIGEDQRMVFVLREYEGLDYRAIAEVMDVSEGTIKSRLHRAKEALRNRLEPYMRTAGPT
jgi:RNA polymerase sigma factor (sigma-70 family)